MGICPEYRERTGHHMATPTDDTCPRDLSMLFEDYQMDAQYSLVFHGLVLLLSVLGLIAFLLIQRTTTTGLTRLMKNAAALIRRNRVQRKIWRRIAYKWGKRPGSLKYDTIHRFLLVHGTDIIELVTRRAQAQSSMGANTALWSELQLAEQAEIDKRRREKHKAHRMARQKRKTARDKRTKIDTNEKDDPINRLLMNETEAEAGAEETDDGDDVPTPPKITRKDPEWEQNRTLRDMNVEAAVRAVNVPAKRT